MPNSPAEPPRDSALVDLAKGIGLLKSPDQKLIIARQRKLRRDYFLGISAGIVGFFWLMHPQNGIGLGIGIFVAFVFSLGTLAIANSIASNKIEKEVAKESVAGQLATAASNALEAANEANEAATRAKQLLEEAWKLGTKQVVARDAAKKAQVAAKAAKSAAEEAAEQAKIAGQAAMSASRAENIEAAKKAEPTVGVATKAAIAAGKEAAKQMAAASQALDEARDIVSAEGSDFSFFLQALNQVETFIGLLKGANENTRNNLMQSISMELSGIVLKLRGDANAVALIRRDETLQNLLRAMDAGLRQHDMSIIQAKTVLQQANIRSG